MNASMQHNAPNTAASAAGALLYGRSVGTAGVARMKQAAESWLLLHGTSRSIAQAVTHLSAADHAAMKAAMLAAMQDELPRYSDLDQMVAYLQALGQLAQAGENKAAP